MFRDQGIGVRIFFAALENENITPYKSGRFSFIKDYTDKTRTKMKQWKNVTVKGKGKEKFISYHYKIPKGLPNAGKWKRFKVYEDINRENSHEYTQLLLDAVRYCLEDGYNPFKNQIQQQFIPAAKQWTIQQGLSFFIQKYEERLAENDIDKQSVSKYREAVSVLQTWLTERNLQNSDIKAITRHHIQACLADKKEERDWSNRQFNNTKSFLSTCFNFLATEKIITDNPCDGIKKKKTLAKKHRAYNKAMFDVAVKAMQEIDPYMLFCTRIIYYLCIRSDKELKHLKVKHIDAERMQVWVMAENAKTDRDRLVPMCEEMLKIFKEAGILDMNPEYYVITGKGCPGPKPMGKGFISKRYGKLRKKAGIPPDYTPYAWKHTRVVHLKRDGAEDADIMALTGHTSFQAYSDYLRDLGMDVDPKTINKYTRTL